MTAFEEYWVDTARDSAVVRHITYSNSKPINDMTVRYNKSAHGWLPSSWRWTVYLQGRTLYTEDMRVEQFTPDPAVTDADFQMGIEPGMVVEERTDHATQNPLVTPKSSISVYQALEEGGRKEMPDPYGRPGDQYQEHTRNRARWGWFWLVLAVPVIAGFVYWARRHRTE
jgi:hypothetical protein